ncbi:hypothetical protein [uncultured Enterococcus sp.]|uniref:hypothetical protein n=1 Tax=uncultured Enterococcus sp. TaxID=167972 RepID=UPI002AA86B2E|nr:hypothetical protein [uncultured Enterococcus sp.]
MWIWFILVFIVAHVIIEKELLPAKMRTARLRMVCLYSIGGITLAIIAGLIVNQPLFVVGTVTIFFGSLVSWKNREKFEKMERGESR